LKPWQVASWCIPQANGAYVAAMEDVLAVYQLPYDATVPTICLDEYGFALTDDTRPPLPARPGDIAKQDYEYSRHGSCSLFGAVEPHTGTRIIQVFARRTRREFAQMIKTLLTEHYPDAIRVRLVLDNLNTHTPGALYETFPAAEASALAGRIEWHFTPKHGSWLNMQEIEWAILKRQVLRHQRLASIPAVEAVVTAWASARTQRRRRINWRFTVADARLTMHHVYPIPSQCPDTA
jgi:transposase